MQPKEPSFEGVGTKGIELPEDRKRPIPNPTPSVSPEPTDESQSGTEIGGDAPLSDDGAATPAESTHDGSSPVSRPDSPTAPQMDVGEPERADESTPPVKENNSSEPGESPGRPPDNDGSLNDGDAGSGSDGDLAGLRLGFEQEVARMLGKLRQRAPDFEQLRERLRTAELRQGLPAAPRGLGANRWPPGRGVELDDDGQMPADDGVGAPGSHYDGGGDRDTGRTDERSDADSEDDLGDSDEPQTDHDEGDEES